ncbi:hypothetical protein ACS0TY_033336 [Phlomoides rotata]
MRSKKRTAGASAEVLSQSIQNLPHEPKLCFEGESLTHFLKSIQREIESARASDASLPPKFWTKQQFAVGVNEVTRTLERMPFYHGNNSSEEHFPVNRDDAKAPGVHLQVACCVNPVLFLLDVFCQLSFLSSFGYSVS